LQVPKIVDLHGRKSKLLEDGEIYIGYRVTMGGWNLPESKWNNPHRVKVHGVAKSLEMYENVVRTTPALMESLGELRGKVLACWCPHEECHGSILIKLLKEKFGNSDDQRVTEALKNISNFQMSLCDRVHRYVNDSKKLLDELANDLKDLETKYSK